VSVTYRLAAPSDAEAMRVVEVDAGRVFRSVHMDAVADDDPPEPDVLLAYISERRAWVAEFDDDVVGYATASVVDGEGHLDQVSVVGEVAGRGIGRALIESVCDWTRSKRLPSVTLTTYRDVAWNGPYYERLGFVVIEEPLTMELAAIRRAEQAAGLDAWPRVAMRRLL
jgi:GNAT superfamily N-acetyltransferase